MAYNYILDGFLVGCNPLTNELPSTKTNSSMWSFPTMCRSCSEWVKPPWLSHIVTSVFSSMLPGEKYAGLHVSRRSGRGLWAMVADRGLNPWVLFDYGDVQSPLITIKSA